MKKRSTLSVPTIADGTTIHQWQFHGGNSQKWIFEHQGDGFYTIKSANATAAYYLGVINDEVVVNSDIVLRDDEITGGMEWNVSVTDSGAFKLTAKKGYSLGYALATTTSDATNGAKLIHGAYVDNDSYRDEWYLEEAFFFDTLIKDNIITAQDIKNTDDGLYILTVSLADILNDYGIDSLPEVLDDTEGENNSRIVSNFYDDWYLFALEKGSMIKYGLYKMREQENDKDGSHDDDIPGVAISFVQFDITALRVCISSDTHTNRYNLLQALKDTIEPIVESFSGDGFGFNLHDDDISQYFADVNSDGAYLIAENYVKFIAGTADNGIIAIPDAYDNTDERLETAMQQNNLNAGYDIYNSIAKTITIANPNNLTMNEKYAILISHTQNVTFNSFAAEVEFHADGLYGLKSDLLDWYVACIVADMGLGQHYHNNNFNDYYDLDSDLVQAQIEAHGEY